MPLAPRRLVVLASGRGSNFAAIVEGVRTKKISPAIVTGLFTNNPAAPALEIANHYGIPTHVIDSTAFRAHEKLDRDRFEQAIVPGIEQWRPDLICLAGYMLVLGPTLLSKFSGKILNIHPSLLPSFRGLHAVKQALDYGVRWTGCTVHWVNEALDGGPIIAQNVLRVEPGDTEETLSARLLRIEHQTYVETLNHLVSKF